MTSPVEPDGSRQMTPDDFTFLMQTPLFDAIPDDARYHLLSSMQAKSLKPGDKLITQGDHDDEVYIIQEGHCEVAIERSGTFHMVDRFGPRDIVGEMAILTGEPRSATVEAETDMLVWAISREILDNLFLDFPELRAFLTRIVTNRLSRAILTTDRTIGKYVTERVLGSGGASIVYDGYHAMLNMRVAIKMLKHNLAMDPAFMRLFRNEAQTIAQLNHENIVKVYDVEEMYRTFFIIMEQVGRGSLKRVLEHKEKPPLPVMLSYLLQVCAGLLHAHEQGIIHRDVKPGNVLISDNDQVKIVDFGLACAPGTTEKNVTGTVLYLAPEQIKSDPIDERSDIYALGLMAYEMFCGRRACPYDDVARVLSWHLTEEAPDPCSFVADLPPELIRFLIRSTQRDPLERYQSVKEILVELEPLAQRLGLKSGLGPAGSLNMMSLFLFYREEHAEIMQRLVKEFSGELKKIGAKLRGTDFKDIQQ